ncbi:MAG: ribokinase [Chloroflexota bacterium]|nr:ribokinase [Chloroflexota bacterium]
MGRVVVIGSINVDLVVAADHLPRPGETVLGGRFARYFGGKGANQAVAAARAGASVTMVGAVGWDADGDASLAALTAEGIDVSRVRRTDVPTGVAIIAVAADGENQIVVASGANGEVSADDASLRGMSDGPGVMLTCLEIPMPTVLAGLAASARIGLAPVVNPAPAQRLPPELLAARPILTPNHDELLVASGEKEMDAAFASLAGSGAMAVVVTLGAAGAVLAEGKRRTTIRAGAMNVVDATGAGDTFSGVLAAWLADSRPLEEAVAAASAAAGLSVTRPGARGGMPTRQVIEAALRG